MAEIYEQYLKNKHSLDPENTPKVLDRVGPAMDQTELLQGVARRVQAWVEEYQKWEALSLVFQTIKGIPMVDGPGLDLTFDDLKILLDQLPQKDF